VFSLSDRTGKIKCAKNLILPSTVKLEQAESFPNLFDAMHLYVHVPASLPITSDMVYVLLVLTTVPLRVMAYLGSGRPSDLHVMTTDVPTTAVFGVNVVLFGLTVKKTKLLVTNENRQLVI
jgi:hypothetical protein